MPGVYCSNHTVEVPRMPGSRLCLREREEIRAGIERGWSLRMISQGLGRCPSTVSREVAANGGRNQYRAVSAHGAAKERALRPKPFKLVAVPGLAAAVTELLVSKKYSPLTTARILGDRGQPISAETIYRACYQQGRGLGGEVWKSLPRRRQKRKHAGRKWGFASADALGIHTSIHHRPQVVAARSEPGHLEGDLIYGAHNRSAVATYVERVSRHTTLVGLPSGYRADLVAGALTESLSEVPEPMRKTLTWDQGREMRKWKQIEEATGIPIYFCDIHSPWQKPSVENNNGILRRWLPKGTPLDVYTQDDLDAIAELINQMPRKIHNWRTAQQVYDELLVATTS
jgi:IS30 family transposase